MKRIISVLLAAALVFSSCATTKKTISIDRAELSGFKNGKIAYVMREPEPLKAYTYEANVSAAALTTTSIILGVLLGVFTGFAFVQVYEPKSQYLNLEELSDPFMEVRSRFVKRFAKQYAMEEAEAPHVLKKNESFRISMNFNREIDYFIDIKPKNWQLRWFDKDTSKYYYHYQAHMTFARNFKGTKVLGEMMCDYRSARAPEVQYEKVNGKRILAPEVAEFYDDQPTFEQWYQNHSRLIYKHTEKAIQYCLGQFQEKVIGGAI